MVSQYMFLQVRSLIDQGLSNSEISQRLKIDRATVRKYRQSNAPPIYKPRLERTRDNPLIDFELAIDSWLESRSDLSATSIFLFLKGQGYKGSLRTVERRVAVKKSNHPKERFFEQEYTPAEQSQFDFKEAVTIGFQDGKRVCQLFIGTLPYSGRFFVKAFPNKTWEAFAEGFHSFFESVGGMSKGVRFDNLSPVVKKVLKGSERHYTDAFERALKYYGFKPLPCAPGKGSEKGDCERDIRTFARRLSEMIFLSGRIFQDFKDLNFYLEEFSKEQLTEKQLLRFSEEQALLLATPPRDQAVLSQVHVTTVSKHGTARISRASYSVPDKMIGRQVKIVVSSFDVEIYQVSPVVALIATHPRVPDNSSSILLEHTIGSLVRKPQAMVRWAHRKILFPQPVFEKYYQYLRVFSPNTAESEFLKSINLIHHVSLEVIATGLAILVENKSQAPFFDLKSLVITGPHFPTLTHGAPARCQPPLSTELAHYDKLIPAA